MQKVLEERNQARLILLNRQRITKKMRDSKEKDRNKYAGEKKRDNANKKLKTIEEYHKNREKWNFCTN
jgi:hypothetical protein